jgi:alpha-amylase/alpha-mannosidase (GH57 family)
MVGAACTRTSDTTTTTDTLTPPTTATAVTTTTAPAEYAGPPLYVNLMWHQHQPFYPKNEDGLYTRPWVRVHATKDYLDMAAMVEQYPGLEVTFNLTPVLLLQLEDLAAGAKDVYWEAAEKPAVELSKDEKQFLVERFFDVNPLIIERLPRFQELAADRAAVGAERAVAAWLEQDFRDLQVLFNLAWTDPDFLVEEPLASLVAHFGTRGP